MKYILTPRIRQLQAQIIQLCQHECPKWWFPYAKQGNSYDNLLSIADCLSISNSHHQTKFASLSTKWSYLKRCLQQNYDSTIPQIHIYNGQQSGIEYVLEISPLIILHSIKLWLILHAQHKFTFWYAITVPITLLNKMRH